MIMQWLQAADLVLVQGSIKLPAAMDNVLTAFPALDLGLANFLGAKLGPLPR